VGPIIFWKKINIYIVFQKCTSYKKFLEPSNIKRDQLFKTKCDNIMKQFNLSMNNNTENEERYPIIEIPKKTTVDKQVSPSTSL